VHRVISIAVASIVDPSNLLAQCQQSDFGAAHGGLLAVVVICETQRHLYSHIATTTDSNSPDCWQGSAPPSIGVPHLQGGRGPHSGGSAPERTAPCGMGAVRFARADCWIDSKSANTWASSLSGGGGGRPVVVGLGGVIAPEAP